MDFEPLHMYAAAGLQLASRDKNAIAKSDGQRQEGYTESTYSYAEAKF